MKPTNRDPQRWSELSSGESLEARVGLGLRQVRGETEKVPPVRVSRMRAQIKGRVARRRVGGARLVWVCLGLMFLISTEVASALVVVGKLRAPSPSVAPAPAIRPSSGLGAPSHRKRSSQAPSSAPLTEPTPEPVAAPAAAAPTSAAPARDNGPLSARPTTRQLARALEEPPPAPGNSGTLPASPDPKLTEPLVSLLPAGLDLPADSAHAQEAVLMAGIVRALRRLHEPRLALQRLDEHAARFPSGMFEREATLARIEAHLALGEHAQALATLEPLSIEELPRPRPVRLLRAELRAAGGQCPHALADFNAVIEGHKDDIAERALRGRAICRVRMGDQSGAHQDVERHLRTFPHHPQGQRLREHLGSP